MREIPEWVHVWAFLRFVRAPQVMDPLPQQEEPEDLSMSMAKFYDYLAEWKRSGSPKITREHLAVLGLGPLYEVPPF